LAVSLVINHRFDPASKKHYLNEWNTVLHCHHYASLFTELAMCTAGFGGIEKLVQTGEKVFGAWLKDYYSKQLVQDVNTRREIAEEYWRTMGMGLIRILTSGSSKGTATMEYSHIDEGWIKKFGGYQKPVNFFTCGFLAGAFEAMYDKPFGSYTVEETASLVKGDAVSRFEIELKKGES
jgi:hypothetical protein